MPNTIGRSRCQIMDMNGGNSASYLARTPCILLFCTLCKRGEHRKALDYQGRAGIISIVRWKLSPGHTRYRSKCRLKISLSEVHVRGRIWATHVVQHRWPRFCLHPYPSSATFLSFKFFSLGGHLFGPKTRNQKRRGLLEKRSFQKSSLSRDSREFGDSREFREPPDCGK